MTSNWIEGRRFNFTGTNDLEEIGPGCRFWPPRNRSLFLAVPMRIFELLVPGTAVPMRIFELLVPGRGKIADDRKTTEGGPATVSSIIA